MKPLSNIMIFYGRREDNDYYFISVMFFGLFLGVILAFMKISGVKILQAVAAVYVEVIRGTPVLVQISLVFLDFRSLESSSLILKYGEWILKGCQPVCWH